MSTILKALRRLEEEREQGARASLREEVLESGASGASARRWRWPLWLAAALFCLAAGAGIAWQLLESSRDADPVQAQVAAAPGPAAAAVSSAPRAGRELPSPEAAVPDSAPAVGLQRPTVVEFVPETSTRVSAPAAVDVALAVEPSPPARAADPPGRKAVAREDVAESESVTLVLSDSPVRVTPRVDDVAVVNRSAAPEEARLLVDPDSTLAKVVRSKVPDLVVRETQWHPNADRRVAIIELKRRDRDSEELRVQEGDLVGPLQVEKITPSGVVFDHQGVELTRRVGE